MTLYSKHGGMVEFAPVTEGFCIDVVLKAIDLTGLVGVDIALILE